MGDSSDKFMDQDKIRSKKSKDYGWDFPGGPWLRLCAPKAGALGSIPGERTRSHMLKLRPSATKEKNKY